MQHYDDGYLELVVEQKPSNFLAAELADLLLFERRTFRAEVGRKAQELDSAQKALALTELQMNLECDGRVAAERELKAANLQVGDAVALLRRIRETYCSMGCPIVWKTVEGRPHTPLCKDLTVFLDQERLQRMAQIESEYPMGITAGSMEKRLGETPADWADYRRAGDDCQPGPDRDQCQSCGAVIGSCRCHELKGY